MEMTSDYPQAPGRTTIAPGVLLTMTRLSALAVPGVSRMGSAPRTAGLLRKDTQQDDGVILRVADDTVYVELYVVIKNDVNIRTVSHILQRDVARTIAELVGMNVGGVNVHIEDIDYPEDPGS
jgi:uncharacterized alkaline shock family protein YloU